MAETKQGFGTMQEDKFNRANKSGSDFKAEIQDVAGGVATAVKDKARDIASSATDIAEKAKDKAQDWASTAAGKVGDTRSAVGSSLESFGHRIREQAPREGMLGTAASGVAEGVESAGEYLREHDLGAMGKDMTNLVRRYPIQSLLIGVGIGFLLARSTRS